MSSESIFETDHILINKNSKTIYLAFLNKELINYQYNETYKKLEQINPNYKEHFNIMIKSSIASTYGAGVNIIAEGMMDINFNGINNASVTDIKCVLMHFQITKKKDPRQIRIFSSMLHMDTMKVEVPTKLIIQYFNELGEDFEEFYSTHFKGKGFSSALSITMADLTGQLERVALSETLDEEKENDVDISKYKDIILAVATTFKIKNKKELEKFEDKAREILKDNPEITENQLAEILIKTMAK